MKFHEIEKSMKEKMLKKLNLDSETYYRIVADYTYDWETWMLPDGRYCYVSPSCERISGYRAEEFMTNQDLIYNICHPDDIGLVREHVISERNESLKKKEILEFRVIAKDGKCKWIGHMCQPVYDSNGNFIGKRGSNRDMTSQKEAEKNVILKNKQLQQSLKEQQNLIETVNVPIFGIGVDGRVNEWNQTAERITGFIRNDVIGRDLVAEFITEKYKRSVQDVLDKAIRGEETSSYEFQLYTKDNRYLMVLLNASSRRNHDGNVVGVLCMGHDITEIDIYRSQMESMVEERTRELKRSLEDTEKAMDRIDGILKSVADGLIVTDNFNKVVLMNRSAEDILNVRLSDVIGRSIDFAIREETLREKVKDTLQNQKISYEFDFEQFTTESENIRIMRARTSVIYDKTGDTAGIVTIIHDVTQDREIDRMKTEFISTAAHELRTPLTSIQGFSEILLTRDNIASESKVKYLTYINKQAMGLAEIINDLLDISRIESGRGFSLDKSECSVGQVIKDVVPCFMDNNSKHTFEILIPDESIKIIIDRDKMSQMFKNLLSNSVKYSPDGGIIRIIGRLKENEYHVTVEDEGIGMTSEQLEKVFEKFYRADASTTAVEGTGLGMTIVKYIVEAHGGTISIESQFGRGTSVNVILPFF